MIDSPVLREFEAEAKAEATADAILTVLRTRFAVVSDEVGSSLRSLRDPTILDSLLETAVRCPDLDAFRTRIPS